MATMPTQKVKALRVQGSRSRTGCQTCKLKRVKCDEVVPVCGRCSRNNRTCHYEAAGNAVYTAGSKFIVYTVPQSISPAPKIPPHDSRALWHFQHRSLQQIEGPFITELWSTIIPRLIQTDSIIRQAIIALSTLHEYYLSPQPADPILPDRALIYYQKARQQIIGLETPDDSFDSILCASVIFSACEGLRGNFSTATQHAIAGMKMIVDRKSSTSHAVTMLTASEKSLFYVFLDLQSQVLEANEDGFELAYPGLEEHLFDMPTLFASAEQAVVHLQILVNQILDLYHTAVEHHETIPWIPSQVSPALQPVYEAICSKFHVWKRAVTQMEDLMKCGDNRKRAAYVLLKIFALAYKMYLYAFVHGEERYDDLIQTNYHILSLVETYLCFDSDKSTATMPRRDQQPTPPATSSSLPSSYSLHTGITPVLFEIATRTANDTLRQKAIHMLRYSNKREGVWDGHSAASLAEKLFELKRDGQLAAATQYVGYRFLVTDIVMLSDRTSLIRSGFKKIQPGCFGSWWVETILPHQGILQSQVINLP